MIVEKMCFLLLKKIFNTFTTSYSLTHYKINTSYALIEPEVINSATIMF